MMSKLARYGLEGRKIDLFPLFDSHSHVGKWSIFDAYDVKDHVAEMDRIGVRVSVISSLIALQGDIRRGNDVIAAVLKAHPGRFLGYVHVSANYPDLIMPELKRCFAIKGFKGIKVYQTGTPFDDSVFKPVWTFARQHGAPVLAHTWAGNLTGFDKVAKAHPDVSFIAAHAGSAGHYKPYIEAARRAKNLYLDLTYSRDHAGLIEHFVETVGANRLVWGSDEPLFSMAQQVGKTLFARISDSDKKKILSDNGARLFGAESLLR